jgi:hypothetical protein
MWFYNSMAILATLARCLTQPSTFHKHLWNLNPCVFRGVINWQSISTFLVLVLYKDWIGFKGLFNNVLIYQRNPWVERLWFCIHLEAVNCSLMDQYIKADVSNQSRTIAGNNPFLLHVVVQSTSDWWGRGRTRDVGEPDAVVWDSEYRVEAHTAFGCDNIYYMI